MKAPVQTDIKTPKKASYVAYNVSQFFNKGSAIESKIETVLNQLRDELGVKGLKRLDEQTIESYTAILQECVQTNSLSRHTAETYISALNRVIEYTNNFLNKDLQTVKQSEFGLSRGSFEYKDRSVSESTHEAFLSFLNQNNDIKAQALIYSVELQRAFGLRLRESLAIKQETIRDALRTNVLHLTSQDGTKNSRSRDIPILNEQQREILKSVLDFQKQNNLKSLIPTTYLREQYNFAKNMQYSFNKSNSDYFHFHGERHSYAQCRIEEGASKIEVSRELGHNRQEVTKTYANI